MVLIAAKPRIRVVGKASASLFAAPNSVARYNVIVELLWLSIAT